MTSRIRSVRQTPRSPSWLAALCIAIASSFAPSFAHADWSVVQADAPVTVIHDASLYQAGAGQRLGNADIVETASHGIVQIQDDAGNLLALGAQTRVLLERNARVSLLDGWVKLAHACGGTPCLKPVVETSLGVTLLGDDASIIVAALRSTAPSTQGDTDMIFSESGTSQLLSRVSGGPAPVRTGLPQGQFASQSAGAAVKVAPRPSSAFLADMPVAFRDALRPLPAAQRAPVHDKPANPPRAVSYDDVSAWLASALPARTRADTRFATRFRSRLSDAAFRRDIDRNLAALTEWRVLLYPPRPRMQRASHFTARYP